MEWSEKSSLKDLNRIWKVKDRPFTGRAFKAESNTYKSSEMGAHLAHCRNFKEYLQLEEDERVGDDFLKRLGGQIMCGQVEQMEVK